MPTLPGKELSQAHYDRVVAAFPGNTPAQKAAAYDAWLTNHLIDRVMEVEAAAIQASQAAELDRRLAELRASLPPRVSSPVVDLTPPPAPVNPA